VGAYTAALLTKLYRGARMGRKRSSQPGRCSSVLSLREGSPRRSLRASSASDPPAERSDYLGIATLGFRVIMKVLFDNSGLPFLPQLGAPAG